METDFAVEAVEIGAIKAHPNADRLDIAVIKGWQVVVGRGEFAAGDRALYVPVDAVLPLELSDRWAVTKYLSKQRVRAARLRGEMSYGFLAPLEPIGGAIPKTGVDLTEHYGITKYETPVKFIAGEAEHQNPRFFCYGKIYNYRNFPGVILEGDEVVITEKVHGINCRVGLVFDGDERVPSCGSHNVQRRLGTGSLFEAPLGHAGVEELLASFEEDVILYGELYGRNVQDLEYGREGIGFIAFDLCVSGRFLPWDRFAASCAGHGVSHVPVLYRGPFVGVAALAIAQGESALAPGQMREGCVIKPVDEATNPEIGRVVLKIISDDYLLRNGGSEAH